MRYFFNNETAFFWKGGYSLLTNISIMAKKTSNKHRTNSTQVQWNVSNEDTRSEPQIFADIENLCQSPGFIHAIAFICLKDTVIRYGETLSADDTKNIYDSERLIGTEITTLTGLMLKSEFDIAHPGSDVLGGYIERSYALMDELHHVLARSLWEEMATPLLSKEATPSPTSSGEILREAIFYGGDAAFGFQYRDMSVEKYESDSSWLENNKGFSIQVARDVALAMEAILKENTEKLLSSKQSSEEKIRSVLSTMTITSEEVATKVSLDADLVEPVLEAFSNPTGACNTEFSTLTDFNAACAYPLIWVGEGRYACMQIYGFYQAIYEAPFFWMVSDTSYEKTAMVNRGIFTEEFSTKMLERVFGTNNVHRNVNIFDGKSIVAEIDVLVAYGDRAIVLQAKSKRLTLESRKGNDLKLKDDFKKAIQNAYDQGLLCSQFLLSGKHKFVDENKSKIYPFENLREIYIVCVVADHYPALTSQVREFLNYKKTNVIQPPFVMDVFALDTMTEMLQSPLRFLSYLNRRTNYTEKLLAEQELTLLGYHLKQNLWVDSDIDMVYFGDDIAAELNVAMLVRREGLSGQATPEGILTTVPETIVGRIIDELEAEANPAAIDVGFALLTLSDKAISGLSNAIDTMMKKAMNDGKSHDFGIAIGDSGLTIHCNHNPQSESSVRLASHCILKKYAKKANKWMGLSLRPNDGAVKSAFTVIGEWAYDEARQKEVEQLIPAAIERPKKIGPNERCYCGSGKKYKHCHRDADRSSATSVPG